MDWDLIDLSRDFVPGITPPDSFDESWHIVVSDDEVLTIDGVHPWRPLTGDEFRWLDMTRIEAHYLGSIGNMPVFANEVDPDADNPDGYEFEPLRFFLGKVEERVFNLIGRAKQVVDWGRNHRYCGQCGRETEVSTFDRSRKCPSCDQPFYPRLAPSIIVLVTRGEDLLLAKNANARVDFYSTLAGFVEPGESLEEAVHREVMEEVGIRITNLAYYGSQAWPFPNSLMLGFHAEYHSGEFVFHDDEIVDAKWFHYTDLPHRPQNISIAGRLIDDYIRRLGGD